ncbi:zinc-dependent metalloprotease [Arthrospira platensis FACHB-971]|uniref:zinc-dependent metalloprotease n=2 Tax=Sirenicapillariaceae TaxID=2934961 RepID=UPI0007A0E2C4|nr:zinc-dependent metalloprotease [Arthrospira platensis]AMW26825.1 peptidase M43 [Arthrospira platensis YZ]MBD2671632.1 zinc-dependent metalloprotease [Arthrospira platensis FACHB-439]MBD2712565.1 zinc-dependent metalloprotease [Arthrospira platensis FACHB-835]MDT9297414.1 zinc-dependent metalloprotease [Arthrospira platensis PCC 7345]MBD2573368.1 zinc-dependent metalloprotease [Arthrospira platensis FACHB-971]
MRRLSRYLIIVVISFVIVTMGLTQAIAQIPNRGAIAPFQISQQQTQPPDFDSIIQGTEQFIGLFTLYHKPETRQVYLEIQPQQLGQNFLCFISLESGLENTNFWSGQDLGNFLFKLRSVPNRIELLIPNINFRINPQEPQAAAIERAFRDSVLYSLPVMATHPERQSILIDFSPVLVGNNEFSGVVSRLVLSLQNNYNFDADKSSISSLKAFPNNIEVASVLGFTAVGRNLVPDSPAISDRRAFNLQIRYSFLALPDDHSYRTRLADERIGYFTTIYRDVSNPSRPGAMVRYINRWNLQKQIPSAPLSAPVEPIVFWLENTIPLAYREAIAEGALMWNKAFEKVGFMNAIKVRQMPDNATWDPADVRYNTIRWSTSFNSPFSGYGPSHVNPLTGQILDADMVIESQAIDSLRQRQEILVEGSSAQCHDGLLGRNWQQPTPNNQEYLIALEHFCFEVESTRQLAIGAIAMSVNPRFHQDSIDEYINQYLRYLTAHEIGHTLGLRHNFRGSTMLTPEELNDRHITRTRGMTASVMDYLPVNLAPPGQPQGDYFPVVLGAYDDWAIQYGYQPILEHTPYLESRQLQEIVAQATAQDLAFATDEDVWGIFLDPEALPWDLSSEMLRYSQWQLDNARSIWDRLETRSFPSSQESDQLLTAFNIILSYYANNAANAIPYIGGQSFHRYRIGNSGGSLPLEPISVTQQREALKLLAKYVFAEDAFNFSPNLLNRLVPSRWSDWGNPNRFASLDYPISDRILWVQSRILSELLSPARLTRLRDLEFKTSPGNALTIPELLEMLTNSIWSELWTSEKQISIGPVRRSLQQVYLDLMTNIVLGNTPAPQDAQTLAWFQFKQLEESLDYLVKRRGDRLDAYSIAHLAKSRDRIAKTLGI